MHRSTTPRAPRMHLAVILLSPALIQRSGQSCWPFSPGEYSSKRPRARSVRRRPCSPGRPNRFELAATIDGRENDARGRAEKPAVGRSKPTLLSPRRLPFSISEDPASWPTAQLRRAARRSASSSRILFSYPFPFAGRSVPSPWGEKADEVRGTPCAQRRRSTEVRPPIINLIQIVSDAHGCTRSRRFLRVPLPRPTPQPCTVTCSLGVARSGSAACELFDGLDRGDIGTPVSDDVSIRVAGRETRDTRRSRGQLARCFQSRILSPRVRSHAGVAAVTYRVLCVNIAQDALYAHVLLPSSCVGDRRVCCLLVWTYPCAPAGNQLGRTLNVAPLTWRGVSLENI
ncbi:hypothetical protein BD310DRAFT_612483 [Dichomitus squalens]|uniref:Secreted protein n=1 Tax=Dichomitus squalens TaxID=114155 RepID=A0A4Q9PQ91_9APHY|nr:hypothetical protein BD310DRAFT_612483 [Dichomitus squalens]